MPRPIPQALLALALAAAGPLAAQAPAMKDKAAMKDGAMMKAHGDAMGAPVLNTDRAGIAVKGYDVVAYFTTGTPTPGSASFTSTYGGATFRFASAAHRDAFAAEPAKYLPQYGGYCAYGVAKGGKYDIDPEAWKVENGRLYLNKDKSVQKLWLKDVPGHIRDADAKWPEVSHKKAG